MMRLTFFLLLFSALFAPLAQAAGETVNLQARTEISIIDPGLTPGEWRWLRERSTMRVAVWGPDAPPYGSREGLHDYGGITADFLGPIAQNLNLNLVVTYFTDKQAALDALQRGEVDIVPMTAADAPDTLLSSDAYYESLIAEVTVAGDHHPPARIAYTLPWLENTLRSRYPQAKLTRFNSARQALEELAFGEQSHFVGDTYVARYVINQSNLNQLDIQPQPELPNQQHLFVTTRQNANWITVINKVLYALPESSRINIVRRWNGGIPLSVSELPMILTSLERHWIDAHPTINVAVVGDQAPIAWFDNKNQLRGISSDVLIALSLRTGLKFNVQRFDSLTQALESLREGESDMIAGLSMETIRKNSFLTTRSWLTNSWVLMGQKNNPPHRIALVEQEAPGKWLQQHFPDSTLQPVATWRDGVEQLSHNKTDAVVAPLLVALDRINHQQGQPLQIIQSLDAEPIKLAMGVSSNNYPLASLLDKALLNIPPEDLHALTRSAYNSRFQAVRTDLNVTPEKLYAVILGCIVLAGLLGLQYRRQRKQRRMMQALQDARREALEASRVKSAFLTTMSHEIRTPISAIIGMLELALERPAHAPESREGLRTAHRAAQSLLALIGDILDVARIESNRLVLHPERTNLRELITSVALLFDGLAHQKGLGLRLEIDAEIQGDVLVDPLRLKQILANLLSNAIKFSDSGVITLRAQREKSSDHQLHLKLEIEDQGKGIEASIQTQLFQPFSQGKSDQQAQGSGLGLHICRSLMEMMGGEITLRSALHQGTTVSVSAILPVMEKKAHEVKVEPTLPIRPFQSLSVLVVDDNPVTRMVLQQQLQHLGHQVIACDSGKAALDQPEGCFDLVLTDCNMPEMDGFALTNALHQRNASLPIWGITADAQAETRKRCLTVGMQRCFFKPVTLNTLAQALSTLSGSVPSATVPAHDYLALLPPLLKQDENLQPLLALHVQVLQETLLAITDAPDDDHHSILHRLRGGLELLNAPELISVCEQQERAPSVEGREALMKEIAILINEIKKIQRTTRDEDRPTAC